MLVDGQCTFYDFILKAHIDNAKDAEYNTVAGMILAQMGKIPSEGEKLNGTATHLKLSIWTESE